MLIPLKITYYFLVSILGILILNSCNQDVFIDSPMPPDVTEVTVEGDGGEAKFDIPTTKLLGIYISPDVAPVGNDWIGSNVVGHWKYYDRKGSELSNDSDGKDAYRIVYTCALFEFQIVRDGNTLTATNISNATGRNLEWGIDLEYPFGSKQIYVTALPGTPMKLKEADYGTFFYEALRFEYSRLHVDNQSDAPLKTTVYPYMDQRPYIELSTPDAPWMTETVIEIPVPVCNIYMEWTLQETTTPVKIGSRTYYEGPGLEKEVEVTIPAKFKGTIETEVRYAGTSTSGTLLMRNEILDSHLEVPFQADAHYPVYYDVTLIPD